MKQYRNNKTENMKTGILSIVMVVMVAFSSIDAAAGSKTAQNRVASSLENAVDPEMKLETWMMNDNMWSADYVMTYKTVDEELFGLETWMTTFLFWDRLEVASDDLLTIESWMTNPMVWEKMETVADAQLLLEDWMTNEAVWATKIILKS
jgi:hypothetical protein